MFKRENCLHLTISCSVTQASFSADAVGTESRPPWVLRQLTEFLLALWWGWGLLSPSEHSEATPTRAQWWFTAEGPTWQQQLALHSDRWGHVTFGIPLELLCTQHFCQHSIWWANFTEVQQTCTYPPISKANPVHQNGSWLKANAYKIKLRPQASAPRWNTI